MTIFEKENLITSKDELQKVFYEGCKTSQKIGIEYEKLAINNNSFHAVDYYEKDGIKDFLLNLKNFLHADGIYENGNIIGLTDEI